MADQRRKPEGHIGWRQRVALPVGFAFDDVSWRIGCIGYHVGSGGSGSREVLSRLRNSASGFVLCQEEYLASCSSRVGFAVVFLRVARTGRRWSAGGFEFGARRSEEKCNRVYVFNSVRWRCCGRISSIATSRSVRLKVRFNGVFVRFLGVRRKFWRLWRVGIEFWFGPSGR